MKAVILKKPDEILMRIVRSGICINDVRDFKGMNAHSFPRIGGHEFCGVIEKLGSDVDPKRFSLGQKVVQYVMDSCKTCRLCRRGEENICENLPRSKTLQNPDDLSGLGDKFRRHRFRVIETWLRNSTDTAPKSSSTPQRLPPSPSKRLTSRRRAESRLFSARFIRARPSNSPEKKIIDSVNSTPANFQQAVSLIAASPARLA